LAQLEIDFDVINFKVVIFASHKLHSRFAWRTIGRINGMSKVKLNVAGMSPKRCYVETLPRTHKKAFLFATFNANTEPFSASMNQVARERSSTRCCSSAAR